MSELRGNIITHITNNRFGLESCTYEWVGGPFVSLSIGLLIELTKFQRDLPEEGDEFGVGPYRLKIVSLSAPWDIADCVRMDYPFWWWFVFSHHAFRWLRIAKARFVITLAVWGLADYHPSRIPSFSDIHAVRWLAGLFHRSKP